MERPANPCDNASEDGADLDYLFSVAYEERRRLASSVKRGYPRRAARAWLAHELRHLPPNHP
jgi:hypothetical protein